MAGTYSTTARFSLRRLLGISKGSDIDEGFQRLAEDVDTKMVGYEEDTFAKRPAAGRPNAEFRATDTGVRYRDNGTTWDQILGPGGGAPGAKISRAFSNLFEPSSTRRTEVVLTLVQKSSSGEQTGVFQIRTGGQEITRVQLVATVTNQIVQGSVTFTSLPGEKWEVATEGTGEHSMSSSYRIL